MHFYLLDVHARSQETGKSLPLPLRSITPFLQAQSRQTFHFLASLLIWLFSTLISHRHAQNGVSLTLTGLSYAINKQPTMEAFVYGGPGGELSHFA